MLIAAAAFLAFLPSLFGGFLDLDDNRFIAGNPAIHDLSPAQGVRFFTDPSTATPMGWQGIYRPLRTLDFAIDWAISGGRPFFFHLTAVLYHVLGALLVFSLFGKLLGDSRGAAFWGALVFAVHPLQAESVAWITSRADLLLLVTFVAALRFHIDRRRVLAALIMLLAVFSKESAVVFPAAALAVDLFRGKRPDWRGIAVYAAISAGYSVLWFTIQERPDHISGWYGGSYGMNLLMMARGFLYYAWLIVLPVRQLVDYMLPATSGLDLGAALGIAALLLIGIGIWKGGRVARFAAAWFLITILPVSNLVVSVGIPTAERFLYLPLVGVSMFLGTLISRYRVMWVVPVCLLILAFSRSFDWRCNEAIFSSALKAEPTPLSMMWSSGETLNRAHAAKAAGDRESMTEAAKEVGRLADRTLEFFADRLGTRPGYIAGEVLWRKADALILLGKHREALECAHRAAEYGGGPHAKVMAGAASAGLGEIESGERFIESALEEGDGLPGFRPAVSEALNALARGRLDRGDTWEARAHYRHSWKLFPDPEANREAFEVVRTLD